MTKLIEIAQLSPKFDKSLSKSTSVVSFVPMASVSEVTGSIASEEERELKAVIKGYTYFQNDDILVAKITPCFENGKIALASIRNDHAFGSTEFHVIRVDKNKADSRYLFHFLRQQKIRTEGEKRMTGSGGQRRVPKNYLEDLDIPLPPLPEQRRIAAMLDKAEALRSKRRQTIAKLDQLLQSVFLEMFGDPIENQKNWSQTSILNFCSFITGHPFKSSEFIAAKTGIKLCRGANVLPGFFDWKDEVNFPIEKFEEYRKFEILNEDIIVAMDRPWINSGFKATLASNIKEKILLVQRVARLRPNKYYYSYFLYSLICSQAFVKHCKPTETTIPHISPNDFKSFIIITPPEDLIKKYSEVSKKITSDFLRHQSSELKLSNISTALQAQFFQK